MEIKNESERTIIRHIKEEIAINLQELGWCQGHHEMDGRYCLIGMLRGVVLDSISEWYAEIGEEEMTNEEYGLYKKTLASLCRNLKLPVKYSSVESMRTALYEYNDNAKSLSDILLCLR